MLELDDEKTKKVANVVSNASCIKILDYLAEKEATESDIAKELNLPISTVHYNLQQLMETGLVVVDEYHYSPKGKEVNHYKLANKYIIIAPKKVNGIAQKLKGILPAALITAGAAGLIQLYTMFSQKTAQAASFGAREAPALMAKSAEVATDHAAESAPLLANAPSPVGAGAGAVVQATTPLWQNLALWFLVGALFALLVYAIISYFKKD